MNSRITREADIYALAIQIIALLGPRCHRCKHPLSAPLSVRRGLGPVCHREVTS